MRINSGHLFVSLLKEKIEAYKYELVCGLTSTHYYSKLCSFGKYLLSIYCMPGLFARK